ncbi:MAG: ROK family transcriptional regulator [Spirochaetales bacterium]|nr:ROK family transcriptional regulator [Spirochaetales bacterium]
MQHTGFSHIDNADRNRRVVLNVIRAKGPLSRRKISEICGLSITTAKRLVDELLQEGCAEELPLEQQPKKRGRKPTGIVLNGGYAHSIGVAVQPGMIALSVADLSGRVVEERTFPIGGEHAEALIERICGEVRQRQSKYRSRGQGGLLGVGVGVAGLIDAGQGIVLYCPNLPGWENIPLASQLKRELSAEVLVDDAVRCITLAEKRYGRGIGLNTFLYIYIGRGVGAGIILDDRFYRGSGGLAGEFGHITIREQGPLCNCGNSGCLEALVSQDAILRSVRELTASGVYSALKPKISDQQPLTLQDIEEAAEAGDKLANMVIHNVGENIGTGIADLVNIFDPGVVILGGEVISHLGDHLIEGITRTVSLRGIHSITRRTRILTGSLEGSSAARGAATMMIERYFDSQILNLGHGVTRPEPAPRPG